MKDSRFLLAVFTLITITTQIEANPPSGQRVHQASEYDWSNGFLPYNYTPGNPGTGSSADGKWKDGLRKAPRNVSVVPSPGGALPNVPGTEHSLHVVHVADPTNTDWPRTDDLILTNPHGPIPYSRNPSMSIEVYIDLDKIPTAPVDTGATQYFALRIIAYTTDVPNSNSQYWSGIYVGRVGGIPYFSYRNWASTAPITPIPHTGWYTLGLSWGPDNARPETIEPPGIVEGVMRMYVAAGRVPLVEENLVAIDNGFHVPNGVFYPRLKLRLLSGVFLQFLVPPTGSIVPEWYIGRVSVFTSPKTPTLSIDRSENGGYRLGVGNMIPGVKHRLLETTDLSAPVWGVASEFYGSDIPNIFEIMESTGSKFFKVETLP